MAKDSRYLQPYRDSAKKHGSDTFDVTLWADPSTQQLRFDVFTQMCFLTGKRVLDAGCSRGDLATFLIDRDIEFDAYIGVDGLSDVIGYAQSRGLPRCQFHCGDFVADPSLLSIGDPQVICISGSLNTMDDEQVMSVLGSAWAATSESLIFNFLSDRAGSGAALQTGPARRLDTLTLLDWALEKTWRVAFRQDYFEHGHDATILMQNPR